MKSIIDALKVRLGGFAPTLAPTHDASKVRLGGFAPTVAPADKATKDSGATKIGGGAIWF